MKLVDLSMPDERCTVKLTYDEVVAIQNALFHKKNDLAEGPTEKYDRLHGEFKVLSQICTGNLSYLSTSFDKG